MYAQQACSPPDAEKMIGVPEQLLTVLSVTPCWVVSLAHKWLQPFKPLVNGPLAHVEEDDTAMPARQQHGRQTNNLNQLVEFLTRQRQVANSDFHYPSAVMQACCTYIRHWGRTRTEIKHAECKGSPINNKYLFMLLWLVAAFTHEHHIITFDSSL